GRDRKAYRPCARRRRSHRHRQPERWPRQHFGRARARAARVSACAGLGAAIPGEEKGEIAAVMGKIVLYLADGTTLDIKLARERITIGRRADNDVCLPYPAVSGEHAALVTILSDSFLEDLGSTNGTLVNGKPVAKQFVRDRDQIDIGRQQLGYVADAAAQL